jgi:hypothetical protein
MAQLNQVGMSSDAPPRKNTDGAGRQVPGERFTPLLTREGYTFSQMRIERGGPRAFSAIRLPGWKQG